MTTIPTEADLVRLKAELRETLRIRNSFERSGPTRDEWDNKAVGIRAELKMATTAFHAAYQLKLGGD